MDNERYPENVVDSDTTYRVKSTRLADLKARALAAYFAPQEVQFLPRNVKNGRALALAYITARAVMQRLDTVLGPDNWQTRFDDLDKGSVRCRLLVRFTADGEWIEKADVGGESEQPDDGDKQKAAHSDALKRAAVHFGVGRYLYALPKTWCDYDEQKRCWKGRPQLPSGCVPVDYRVWGAEKKKKVIGLLRSALAEAKQAGEYDRAIKSLVSDYGYAPDDWEGWMENRHADLIINRLMQWTEQIAKGEPNHPTSPIYQKTGTQPAAPQPQKPKEEEKPKADPKKPPREKPTSGADFLARMEIEDERQAKAGRMQRGALKTHVVALGAQRGFSVDVTRWGAVAIDTAVAWAKEFLDELPAPGTVKQSEGDKPPLAVA